MPSPISRAPKARRRQRSVRLTIAVALTTIAALLVLGAVLSGSWLLLTLAAVLGVALGAAATRITHTELMATRREAARDRAEQAQAYRDRILAALPARQPDTLLPLLDALPAPWPQEIGTQVVTALRDTIPDAHYAGAWGYRWSQILDLTAQRTHPHTPPPAPLSPNATEYAHRVMNELRATLELRRQLSHDFAPGAG